MKGILEPLVQETHITEFLLLTRINQGGWLQKLLDVH